MEIKFVQEKGAVAIFCPDLTIHGDGDAADWDYKHRQRLAHKYFVKLVEATAPHLSADHRRRIAAACIDEGEDI